MGVAKTLTDLRKLAVQLHEISAVEARAADEAEPAAARRLEPVEPDFEAAFDTEPPTGPSLVAAEARAPAREQSEAAPSLRQSVEPPLSAPSARLEAPPLARS
jgi:hypothetical protein